MYFCLPELGLTRICGKKLVMTDLWSGEICESIDGRYTKKLDAHDCQILRARLVDEV